MFNKVMKQIMMGGLILPSGIRIGEPLMVPDKMSVSSSSSAANFQAEVLNFYPLLVRSLKQVRSVQEVPY